jgi:hypothetical protein
MSVTASIYQAFDATKIVDGQEEHNFQGAYLNMLRGADRWKPEYIESYQRTTKVVSKGMTQSVYAAEHAAERAFEISNTGVYGEDEEIYVTKRARSMSVGDIVEVVDSETNESVWFICDTFGFRQMEEVSFGTFELAA